MIMRRDGALTIGRCWFGPTLTRDLMTYTFTREAVRDWDEWVAPLLAAHLRAKRRGKAGATWNTDATSIKVGGRWRYLYRASDVDGALVETLLSETRDMAAAKRFFTQALDVVGHTPTRVTTDGSDSCPRAIRDTLGPDVAHRCSQCVNTQIEQDHQ